MKSRGIAVALVAMMLLVFASGCKKPNVQTPTPPAPKPKVEEPPPPPAKPSARFVAEPSRIEPGQAVTLRWSTTNAEKVAISGVGDVAQQGSTVVTPRSTTTYILTATGPGGDASASATVNVASPAPEPPKVDRSTMKSLSEMLSTMLSDALFDYNKSDIREDARAVLAKNSDSLKSIFGQMPDAIVVVEGHCDERGSAEYNLGLADRRASKAKEYLVQMGVTSEKLRTVSYGKERPVCTESNEDCWQRNRRAHFAPGQ